MGWRITCGSRRGAKSGRAAEPEIDQSSRSRAPLVFGYRDGGFALIVVLWVLVLIAFIVAHITTSARIEARIASNLVTEAAARAVADGAIFAAIFNQSDPRPGRRWPVDGKLRELIVGGRPVEVRLEDEAWRINPSAASPALLAALLRATGSDPAQARRLASAIGEWVGSTPIARPRAVVLAEYRAAGLDYGPPGTPLATIDELGQVLGMTPAVLAAIRPHLTLYGPPEPSAASPDPFVAAALAEASRAGAVINVADQPPPDVHTTRITVIAFGPGKARVTRSAVVRFGAVLPRGYAVLHWGNGF
jgi:general secretion pathway protein K